MTNNRLRLNKDLESTGNCIHVAFAKEWQKYNSWAVMVSMHIKPKFMGFGVCLATQDGIYFIHLNFFMLKPFWTWNYHSIFGGIEVLVECLNVKMVFCSGYILAHSLSSPLFISLLSAAGHALYLWLRTICQWHWTVFKVSLSYAWEWMSVLGVCPWHIIILVCS